MSYPHTSADCGGFHDLVRDFGAERPTIICLCGSTRFGEAFQDANLRFTLAGMIVLSIGCDMRSDAEIFGDATEDALALIKAGLDALHKRKIDLCDEVFVLDLAAGALADVTLDVQNTRRVSVSRSGISLQPDEAAA